MAIAQETFEQLKTAGLAEIDPEIAELLGRELERQRGQIELIASENFTWPSVLEAVGSVPTNKYAEGYPGKRYYGGCEVVDEIEELARERAKALFGAEHANVQAHAGAQANMTVYFAVLSPGDRVLGLSLDHGGHLTHGLKVNFSGKLYEFHHYGVSRETMMVDYDEVLARAKEVRPKLIVCGGSAYPRTVEADKLPRDRRRGGRDADVRHGALLGPRRGRDPSEPGAALATSSPRRRTRRSPARAPGSSSAARSTPPAVDKANFPGMQGGPLMHTIAAKAACFRIAATDAFRDYQQQVRTNADTLAAGLIDGGFDVLTGGTDTHLVQLDLRATEWTGLAAQERLEECRLTVNRNTVPFDERPPMVASGVRIGTPAATMRGFDEDDFREVASIIVDSLSDDADVAALRGRVEALCDRRPLYPASAATRTPTSRDGSQTCLTRLARDRSVTGAAAYRDTTWSDLRDLSSRVRFVTSVRLARSTRAWHRDTAVTRQRGPRPKRHERHQVTTRSSGTSSGCCGTSRPTPRCSAGSSTS